MIPAHLLLRILLMTALTQAILQSQRKQLIPLSIALSLCGENSYSMNMVIGKLSFLW